MKPKKQGLFILAYSIALAYKGDIEKALKLIKASYIQLKGFKHEEAQYFEHLGRIYLLAGDYQNALEALKQSLKISLEIAPESDHISQTKRLLGDLYFATGEYDKAQKYASEGLAVAEKINERVEIAACWRVFGQLEHQRGNDDKAREWFAKAVELFNQISSRYELAVTRYLAARDGLYYDGERIAALYMAREYFESEDIEHYVEKVDRELKKALAEHPVPHPHRDASDNNGCPQIITGGLPLKKLVTFAEHVAGSEMTVLLTGETGTGKDLFAKYIHYQSGRPGNFVAFNAAAVPNSMIESELFGYIKGAFTGAEHDKPGLFEMADNGTFYLNEIADASLEFQVKLIEALESRTVRRLGENQTRKVNFRLIAATNHDLKELVNENRFRLDLYHRLNEIPITLPPLSDRPGDFVPLVEFFLRDAGLNNGHRGIEHLAEILSQRIWPGNVRQLRAEINRLWLESRGDIEQLIKLARDYSAATEREQLLQTLEVCGWNRREAARRLGISEATVRRWIEKHDLAASLCSVSTCSPKASVN
ncbi:MAG: sigma 54-interacting transcriptional regulator [Candidatus Zixiibacteriota bacterium]